jgi:AcrR family transcriptional regulator
MPPPTRSSPKPRRRTQAERRAATQAAVLDATIDCLVEYGYVNTTTTRIAERAGVSRGAQVHHFPTKAILVSEALARLARRRTELIRAQLRSLPSDEAGYGALLDLIWEDHTGALFDATLEMWVAARTDAELRTEMLRVEREVTETLWTVAEERFGEIARTPEWREAVEVALATIRGLALLRITSGAKSRAVERRWAAARARLLDMLA